MTRRFRSVWAVGLVLTVIGAVSGTKAAAPQGRYTVSTSTVLDNETGLAWQRTDDGVERTWADAKSYCPSVELEGTGWRLPTSKELLTLIDYSRTNPAIDTVFVGSSASYWTSSARSGPSGYAWYVGFGSGDSNNSEVGNTNRVRCVR